VVNVHQERVADSPYQEWRLTAAGSGFVYVVNQQTGLYLTHAKTYTHVSPPSGADVSFTQRWMFEPTLS
jgi:hypothetical protein